MVKRICLLMGILLLTGCGKRCDLIMKKTPYLGNELRIDGYYYSNLTSEKDVGVAIFYRDGFCIHTWRRPVGQDTLSEIESEILLNEAYIAKTKKIPAHIGAFCISGTEIAFEVWGYKSATFSYSGKILNDTTFIINKMVNNEMGKSFSYNLTYRFQQFSHKPDSTNNFVK